MVLDPLATHKLELYVLCQIIQKYYHLKDKNRYPRFLKLSSKVTEERTNYLAEKLNSKITDKDILMSKLFDRQKKALLGWLVKIVDQATVWLVTPLRIMETSDFIRQYREKLNSQNKYLISNFKRLAVTPTGRDDQSAKESKSRPTSTFVSKSFNLRMQSARTEAQGMTLSRTDKPKRPATTQGRPLLRPKERLESSKEFSLTGSITNAKHQRSKSATIDKVPMSDLLQQEQAEILVVPTQIEVIQTNKINLTINKKFKIQPKIRPSSALLERLITPKHAVLSSEDYHRIYPRFSEEMVGHLSTIQKELLKYAMGNDYKAVSELLGKMEYGDCEFAGKQIGSPLFWAVKNKNMRMVCLLLEKGASPNRPTKNGEICLHEACRGGSKEVYLVYKIVEKLIQFRSNIHLKNNSGDTPFHVAHYCIFSDEVWIQKMEMLYLNNPWNRR